MLQVITTSHSVSVMATATGRRIRYHCIVCSSECEKRSIRCVDCGRWTHVDCVGFCERVMSVRGIDFVCLTVSVCGRFGCKGNGKVFPYSLPSVGPGADPGVQAVSRQVT